MTISLWCLALSTLIPYFISFTTGYFRKKQYGNIDNKDPREQQRNLEGTGARLVAAQQNMWENLALFIIAVLIAKITGADQAKSDIAAMIFVGARLGHPVAYALNIDKLRSALWLVGFVCCGYLIYLSAVA